MEKKLCTTCRLPTGVLVCGHCQGAVCKKCAQTLEKNSFYLLETLPAELSHRTYCGACFIEKVAPALESYGQTLENAKAVFVFFKSQGQETRLMNRTEKPLRVVDCPDRDEAVLRLAFSAAKAGFNALINVEVAAKKIRNFGFQTSTWQGSAIPTLVDREKLERESRPGKILLTH